MLRPTPLTWGDPVTSAATQEQWRTLLRLFCLIDENLGAGQTRVIINGVVEVVLLAMRLKGGATCLPASALPETLFTVGDAQGHGQRRYSGRLWRDHRTRP